MWETLLPNSPWAGVISDVGTRLLEHLGVAVKGVTGEPGSWLYARVYGGLRDLLIYPHCELDLFAASMNPAWLAHYTYFRNYIQHIGAAYPPEADETLSLHGALDESCGPWLPCERACLVSDRARAAALNERGASTATPALLLVLSGDRGTGPSLC